MEVLQGRFPNKHLNDGVVCALGFFDGVHLGHQKLIKLATNIASEYNLKSMVYTFEQHPLSILNSGHAPKLIIDNKSKIEIFDKLGVDIVNFNYVTQEFLNTKPFDFLNDILVKEFNVKSIIAGYNYTFGCNGSGNVSMLKEFGKSNNVHVFIIDPCIIDGIYVSSTEIRKLIGCGNIVMANKLLGRYYSVSGDVIKGKRRGRNLGFPTANISLDKKLIYPKCGVYITDATIDGKKYIGITNIGYNPTFDNDYLSMETHFIGLDNQIYGEKINLRFYDRIRDEIRFTNTDDLVKQMNKDKEFAIEYMKNKSLHSFFNLL